jgi:hypothetical protein
VIRPHIFLAEVHVFRALPTICRPVVTTSSGPPVLVQLRCLSPVSGIICTASDGISDQAAPAGGGPDYRRLSLIITVPVMHGIDAVRKSGYKLQAHILDPPFVRGVRKSMFRRGHLDTLETPV